MMYLKFVLSVLFLELFSIKALNAKEVLADSIVTCTENYISQKVEEVVDDRYGFFSSYRVFYHVLFINNEMRKDSWKEYFAENGISSTVFQTYINNRVLEINSHNDTHFNMVKIPQMDLLDESTFNLILKRERYEVLGCSAISLLIIIIICITSLSMKRNSDFPKGIIRFVEILSFFLLLFLMYKYLVPLEEDIAYGITDNIYNQVSNFNVFEQL